MTDVRTVVIPEELAASVQHLRNLEASITSLRAKMDRVDAARLDTVEQIATAATRHANRRDAVALLALYESLNCPGFTTAWVRNGLPHPQRMRADVAAIARHRPNDPSSGGWVGEWTVDGHGWPGRIEGNYPGRGMPVVYVLYGADASPVYCGSSEQFLVRLKAHHRDGKVFVAWRAVPCRSREDAFRLEDQLLRQHCPPLNRRAGR